MTEADVRGRSLVARLWSRTLDTVFPPRCVSCGSFGAFVCDRCALKLGPADHPRCGLCWQPSIRTKCFVCTQESPAYTAVRSAFIFGLTVRDLVHALKYDGVSAVAPLMAKPMVERLLEWDRSLDGIYAVPMAGMRRRRRGFNQSELLAAEISRSTGLPLVRSLLHRRPGPSQVEQPDWDARRENMRHAFAPGARKPPSSVLLVDDVMTTGATLDACARVLKSEGAERVYGLTFARES